MRLIDADGIIPMMERRLDMQELYLPINFKELVVDEMPTVDAVCVTHCKDCKYYDETHTLMPNRCMVLNCYPLENAWCWNGQKRSE